MPFDLQGLEKKFENLKNKQDSIQVLSLFVQHHKNHAPKIVDSWSKVLKKSPISHRLTLVYLANDVVQHAKKKGLVSLVDGFKKAIGESISLLTHDSIKPSVIRVINIWSERDVYPDSFLLDLKKQLGDFNPLVPFKKPEKKKQSITNNNKRRRNSIDTTNKSNSAEAKIASDFKLDHLFESMNRLKQLEVETRCKVDLVNVSRISKLNDNILNGLKDKSQADNLNHELEETSLILEEAISMLEKEVDHRKRLLEELNKGLIYFVQEQQNVSQMHSKFTKLSQVMTQIKNGDNKVPSPPVDVPSPSDSEDGLNLPEPVSSLDQRLTLLMQGVLESGHAPPQSINPNFKPVIKTPNFQPIQSVVTPRVDQMDVTQPTDMDIDNSDDESDPYQPRLPPSVPIQGSRRESMPINSSAFQSGYVTRSQIDPLASNRIYSRASDIDRSSSGSNPGWSRGNPSDSSSRSRMMYTEPRGTGHGSSYRR